MKKLFRYTITALFGFSMLLHTSCKKLIEVEPPANQLTTDAVFASDEAARAAMLGLYSEVMRLNNYIGNGGMSVLPGLSADEIRRTAVNAGEDAFTSNSLLPNNNLLLTNIWQKGYFHIYQANAIIENLDKSTGVETGLKKQLMGEAKFFRAFFHFYLTNIFGAVPMVMSTDYTENASLRRTDSATLYNQVITDLSEAQQLLAPEYASAGRVRVNKWAVAALLARTYLYQGDWARAESAATSVINAGTYQLETPGNVFLPGSKEAILQFIPSITQIFNTSEAFSFLPATSGTRPTYQLNASLFSVFEMADLRRAAWTRSLTVGGTAYTYPFKYKVRTGTAGAPKTEYNVVLRLAEQYLIRAEARAQQNKTADAQADLNSVRLRAGLARTSAADKASLLQAVENERQLEMFCEWGHRWFDLKRTGRANAVLGLVKGANWQPTDIHYPIPQNEIANNPKLTQNPGY